MADATGQLMGVLPTLLVAGVAVGVAKEASRGYSSPQRRTHSVHKGMRTRLIDHKSRSLFD